MNLFFQCFLISLLILTVLKEFKALSTIWNRFPVFMQFIPTWSFFAPVPNMFDYHLLYRNINDRGDVGNWNNIYSPEDRNSFFCFFWNPEKKFSKAFLDLALELVSFSSKVEDKSQICVSIPYLQILNYIDFISKGKNKVQFLILNNSRSTTFEVAFISEVHPVSGR